MKSILAKLRSVALSLVHGLRLGLVAALSISPDRLDQMADAIAAIDGPAVGIPDQIATLLRRLAAIRRAVR